MMRIGSVQGIQFSFDGGQLSGFQIDKHRKPPYSVREQFKAAPFLSISPINQPYRVLHSVAVEQEKDYVPDTSTFLKTTQELGIGQRQIETFQYQKVEESTETKKRLSNLLIASLSFLFDLKEDTIWQFTLPCIESSLEKGSNQVQLQMHNNVSVELDSTETIEIEIETFGNYRQARIQIRLPKGASKIWLKVNSLPVFDFSETLVICRSDQLREAAIVVSCLPSDRFTPFITLEPPPINKEKYKKLYQKYDKVLGKYLERTGGKLGRDEIRNRSEEEIAEILETDISMKHLQQKLTPQRSWFKRNWMLSNILTNIPLKQVIFLFEPSDQYLPIFDPISFAEPFFLLEMQDIDSKRIYFYFLPKDVNVIYFLRDQRRISKDIHAENNHYYYSSLQELTELAWKRLGPTGKPPEKTLDVPKDNGALYLAGLPCALRSRIPLRPMDAPALSLEELCLIANEGLVSDEAVLIEYTGDASNIIGALYAHYRGAPLIVSPQPNLSSIRQALDSFQQKQEETSKAMTYCLTHPKIVDIILELSDIKESIPQLLPNAVEYDYEEMESKRYDFLEAVQRYLLKDWQSDALSDIEAAVSTQVPDYVVSAVANRRLIAFTTGVPYSFVKKNGIDWSDKAIGHVVSDASLMILSEIYEKGERRPPITFNLIFDPGFFKTSETDDILRTLEQHFTHSILFSKETASIYSLHLAFDLPVEIIFFNTHGTDNAFLLGERPLRDYQIPQWVTLNSRPIVFNNSCLSWTGVGQEFIRAGARGYIGTLWSVDAKSAADFARIVMQRLTQDGALVSETLHKTAVNPLTERSYIYVGTSNAILDQWRDATLKGDKKYLIGALNYLFKSIKLLLREFPYRDSFGSQLIKDLYQEIRYFMKRLEEISFGSSIDIVDVLIGELEVLVLSKGWLNEDPDYENMLISKCLTKLDEVSAPKDMKFGRLESVYYLSGTIKQQHGELYEAVDDLRKSIEYAQKSKNSAGRQYQPIAYIFKRMGRWDEAKEAAFRSKEIYEKEEDELGITMMLGELGQISRRLGQLDEAMRYAIEGYEKAVKIGNRREQAVFKTDQALIYMNKGDYGKAIELASESMKINRAMSNDIGELKSYGIIGDCYIQKRDYSTAERYITIGLERAREIGDLGEEASFLSELGEIKTFSGDLEDAFNFYSKSIAILVKINDLERINDIMFDMINLIFHTEDWPLLFRSMGFQILLCANVHEMIQATAISYIIEAIKEAMIAAGPRTSQAGLQSLLQITSGLTESNEKDISDYIKLLDDVIWMLLIWLEGNNKEAIENARFLDQVTQDAFDLETHITSFPEENKFKNPWRKFLRVLRRLIGL